MSIVGGVGPYMYFSKKNHPICGIGAVRVPLTDHKITQLLVAHIFWKILRPKACPKKGDSHPFKITAFAASPASNQASKSILGWENIDFDSTHQRNHDIQNLVGQQTIFPQTVYCAVYS